MQLRWNNVGHVMVNVEMNMDQDVDACYETLAMIHIVMSGDEYGQGWPWMVMTTAIGGDEYGH